MALHPAHNCTCNICKPDVAKFAEQLDAVGSDKARIAFTSTIAIPPRPGDRDEQYGWGDPRPPIHDLKDTTAEARVYDLGSRPRGAPPIDALFAHHIITSDSFSVVTLLRDVPPALRPDEIEFIVSDIMRRFDAMLRNALLGGIPK